MLKAFNDELDIVLNTGTGFMSDQDPGAYTIQCPTGQTSDGRTRSIEHLLGLAKKAAKAGMLRLPTASKDSHYAGQPYFFNGSREFRRVIEVLNKADRTAFVKAMVEDDKNFGYDNGGPAACIFDTHENCLRIVNKRAAGR